MKAAAKTVWLAKEVRGLVDVYRDLVVRFIMTGICLKNPARSLVKWKDDLIKLISISGERISSVLRAQEKLITALRSLGKSVGCFRLMAYKLCGIFI